MTKRSLHQKFGWHSEAKKLMVFMLVFGIIGGGYMVYSSLAATFTIDAQEVPISEAGRDLTPSEELQDARLIAAMNTNSPGEAGAASRIVNIAESQVGKCENGKNNLPLSIKHYQQSSESFCEGLDTNGPNDGYPKAWCAAFVSWVYQQAGYKKPATCRVTSMHVGTRSTGTPKPGDIVFHNLSHVGIFVKADGDWWHTIEGNVPPGNRDCVHNKVHNKSYWTSYGHIN